MLEARQISLSRNGRALLADISLQAQPGELTMALGPNGAGKSTLLAVLSGRLRPDAGQVRLNGLDAHRQPPARLAQLRAVVEQQGPLPEGWSGRELVAAGAYLQAGPHQAAIEQALADCDAEALAEQPLQRLSGGESARLQLARALCQLYASPESPRCLLLDEPTAALDFAIAEQVMRRLAAIARRENLAVLAVVHDLNLALRHADRVLLLNDGRAAGFGAKDDLMRPEHLEAVYGVRLAELSDGALRAFVPLPG